MENYLLIGGLLLNSALIVINRFVYRLPNWLEIPLLLLGIGLILSGFVLMRK